MVDTERKKIIDMIKDLRDSTDGDDKYTVGMYNGMECIMATLEMREPVYKKPLSKN